MAVDLRPANAAIQNGDLRSAHAICQQALAMDSGNAEAISLMGIIAGRTGNHEAAARLMRDALMLRPQDLHYRRNYVTALITLDRLEEAQSSVDEGLSLSPGHPGLLSMAGIIAGRQGDLDAAVDALRQAAEAQPHIAQIHYNLGELHRRRDEPDEAVASLQRCLDLEPNHSDALNNMAGVLLGRGDFLDSLRFIQRHLEASPKSAQGYGNLSVAMHAAGDIHQAVTCLRNALKLNPSLDDVRFRLINFLISSGQFEEAETELTQWQANAPENDRLLAVQARMLERQGKLAEAREAFEKIGEDLRGTMAARMTSAILLDAEGDTAGAAEVLEAIIEDQPEAIDQIGIRFLLGKCKDSLGQHGEAFEHYAAGNDQRRQGFGTPFVAESSNSTRDTVIDEYRRAWPNRDPAKACQSDRPIFILGMPRSGTSLTEQILGSHRDVFPAGELQLLSRAIDEASGRGQTKERAAFEIIDHEQDGLQNPMIPKDFDAETLRAIGDAYVREIAELNRDSRQVTDKMPYNFLFAPLIQMALPSAKIIHTRRNPLDTCLSCYFQNFSGGSEYAFDLNDLGVYYKNYLKMMDAWREMGVEMLEIDYESLVGDPEPVVRQMLDHCGLDFDPNCLQSHRSKRVVATASYQQVREPIYTRSVARWKRYEAHLQPLVDSLGDVRDK